MARLLGLAALAGVGVLAYRAMKKRQSESQQLQPSAPQPVRDAGPEAMRDQPRQWGRTDERSDESFPASDPVSVTSTGIPGASFSPPSRCSSCSRTSSRTTRYDAPLRGSHE
mgnify:CR=1 FL=1